MKTAKVKLELRREITIQRGEIVEPAVIEVGPAEQRPGERWRCYISIPGIVDQKAHVYGADPLHAFTNVLRFGDRLIRDYNTDFKSAGHVYYWQYPGDHCRLQSRPLTATIRS